MIKNSYKLLSAFLCIIVLTSCGKSEKLLNNKFRDDVITDYKVKEVYFLIDSVSFSFEYYKFFDQIEFNKEIYFFGYNPKTHSLDVFNITGRRISRHIKLDTQGPECINEIMGLNVISPDSILIADNLKFAFVNSNGKIFWKLLRNTPEIFRGVPLAYLNSRDSFEPGFDKIRKSLILYYNPVDISSVFKLPILIEIGIDPLKTELLPFYLPLSLKSDLTYNPLYRGPRACFQNDKVVLNFAPESNIYEYNFITKKVTSYGGQSKFTSNRIKPMKKGTNPVDYILTSLCFFKITYDPYYKIYYRTHWGEMNLKKTEFEFNTYYEKPVYISLFDESFNYLYETRLNIESGIIPELLIPASDGLLVFPFKQNVNSIEKGIVKGYLICFE